MYVVWVLGLGFGVWGLRFGDKDLGLGAGGLGFKDSRLGFRF